MKNKNDEVVYKERLTHLLRMILEIGWNDVKEEKDIEIAYQKRLKFQKITDWKKYRASIDLIDDTEYAIVSAFQYQLGDKRNENWDIGEIYLRLYGILNAVYLQISAFEVIANLLNFPGREEVPLSFHKLRIYQLRNIAASHTVDYDYSAEFVRSKPDINKKTSFRITQSKLEKTGSKITAFDENNISFTFNLKEILTEYESVARNLLVRLIQHSIKELVDKKEDKVEMRNRLEEMLPRLIDYSTIDENEKYFKAQLKRVIEMSKRKGSS